MKLTHTAAAIAAGAALIATAGCSSDSEPASSAPTSTKPNYKTVVYEISGNVGFASYDDGLSAGIEFPAGQTRVELTGEELPTSYASVIVRPESRQDTVTCKIIADGKVLKEDSAKGDANYAECAVYW